MFNRKGEPNNLTLANRWLGWGTLVIFLLVLLCGSAVSEAVKRLILTDGSYQSATEWKQEGDRVRYFSSERGDWEEIPAALVDWKATENWNAAAAESREEELKQVTGDELAARKEEMLNNPQVAPGKAPELRLPPDGGVFLMEELAGQPVLVAVIGNKTEENEHEVSNRLKKSIIPLAGKTQTIELKGNQAKARVHSPTPTIFVDVENSAGPIPGDRFHIVRVAPKSGVRVLAKNTIGLTGDEKVKQTVIESRAEKFSGDWWKLTPTEPLSHGEYAVVIEDASEGMQDLVWDFGVDR